MGTTTINPTTNPKDNPVVAPKVNPPHAVAGQKAVVPDRPVYGTPILIHDGAGHYRGALVFATRYDLGGPDDEPVITAIALDPRFASTGPARGNALDSAVVFHDLPFIDVGKVEDSVRLGYTLVGQFFPNEVPAQIVPKPVVLPAPVAPVLITHPDYAPPTQLPAPGPTAIVGGVRVQTGPTMVPGAEVPTVVVTPAPTWADVAPYGSGAPVGKLVYADAARTTYGLSDGNGGVTNVRPVPAHRG